MASQTNGKPRTAATRADQQRQNRMLALQRKLQGGGQLTDREQADLAKWEDEQRAAIAFEWLRATPRLDLERILGKPRSTIINWAKTWGLPYPENPSRVAAPVDALAVIQWMADFIASNSQNLRQQREGHSDSAAERLREAQAKLAEIKLQEAMGELIHVNDAIARYAPFADKVREALEMVGRNHPEVQQMMIEKIEEWEGDNQWRPKANGQGSKPRR